MGDARSPFLSFHTLHFHLSLCPAMSHSKTLSPVFSLCFCARIAFFHKTQFNFSLCLPLSKQTQQFQDLLSPTISIGSVNTRPSFGLALFLSSSLQTIFGLMIHCPFRFHYSFASYFINTGFVG